jgi:hypothetical protein
LRLVSLVINAQTSEILTAWIAWNWGKGNHIGWMGAERRWAMSAERLGMGSASAEACERSDVCAAWRMPMTNHKRD